MIFNSKTPCSSVVKFLYSYLLDSPAALFTKKSIREKKEGNLRPLGSVWVTVFPVKPAC
jgi:hypothetical protein